MKRNNFLTDNQLKKHTFFYITLMLAFLLVVFMILANVRLFASKINLDNHVETAARSEAILKNEIKPTPINTAEADEVTDSAYIGVYGENTLLQNQMDIMRKTWVKVDSTVDSTNMELLIVSKDTLTDSEIEWFQALVDQGISIFFTELPENNGLEFRSLLGIRRIGDYQTYHGMRTSSELLDGIRLEDTEQDVDAWDVSLKSQTTVYASALVDGISGNDNAKLPALAWRYIKSETSGSVFVCNGSFMENSCACKMLPSIFSYLNTACIYPIVNAFCVTIAGLPETENRESESLMDLYSRDLLGVQHDLLVPEFVRCANLYGGHFTYFSKDYDSFMESTEDNFVFDRNELQTESGLIAVENEDGSLNLHSEDEAFQVISWSDDFKFYDFDTQKYSLLINDYFEKDTKINKFSMSGTIGGLGYYGIELDIEELLNYSGDIPIWEDYCKNLETILGVAKRDYWWLDRVNAEEALNRICQVLNLEVTTTYYENHIELDVDNYQDECWFMLKTSQENVRVEGGTLDNIGYGCYLVTVTEDHAEVYWD